MNDKHTISCRDDENVQDRLNKLQVDNVGIAKRPLHKRIVDEIIPKVRKAFRTTKLPAGLNELELKFLGRVMWPRSIYKYDRLVEASKAYLDVGDSPYTKGKDMLDQFSHAYRSSTSFKFDVNLERNKRALKKGSGLPALGKKEAELPNAMQYVNDVLKPAASLEKCYSIFPGYRTQQSDPKEPKVRLVWMVPVTEWILECEAFDDAITKTVEANSNVKLEFKLAYCTPEEIHAWFKAHSDKVNQWVNIDATQYDSDVGRSELSAIVSDFAQQYEYHDLVSSYLARASLVLAEGDLERNGGMPSGSKLTNIGDSKSNDQDHFESLDRARVSRFIVCGLTNGDDKSIGFSTKLTKENVDKWYKYSRREVNAEKSIIGDFVWNSKWYIDNEMMTRPVFRVLNSCMFMEHQSNEITGSREYIAISLAQQLNDIRQHPLKDIVYKEFRQADKYPIASLDKEALINAADVYIAQHNWQVDWMSSPERLVEQLLSSEYARG